MLPEIVQWLEIASLNGRSIIKAPPPNPRTIQDTKPEMELFEIWFPSLVRVVTSP